MIKNLCIEYSKNLVFSGDIHGECDKIVNKLNQLTDTVLIVCGDIGMGFHKVDYYWDLFKKLNLKLSKKNNHLVLLRGNHDDPDYFNGSFRTYKHIHLVEDYTVVSVGMINTLCIGGGTSIDRIMRIRHEERTGQKTYWGEAELPVFDKLKLDEVNRLFPNSIQIIATHTCPSFAYPTTKFGVASWIKVDSELGHLLDSERAIMDKIFIRLREAQHNITDWYYGHFHEHHTEKHHDINFRLCDCGELNAFLVKE